MTSNEVVAPEKLYRTRIPKEHQQTLDTRLQWLWNQKFGTIQKIRSTTTDQFDFLATTIMLQAVVAKDIDSIKLILERIEGGALQDEEVLEDSETIRP